MELTALKSQAYVHHLALTSPDPAALAAYYADVLDMTAERDGESWRVTGPGRRVLLTNGPARGLAHFGLAVRDGNGLAEMRERAEREGLAPRPFEDPFVAPGAFAVTDPDGNVVVFARSSGPPPRKGLHGPLQHVTFATRDMARFTAFYADALGHAVSDVVQRPSGETTTTFMRSNHEHHTIGVFLQDRTGIDHFSFEAGTWDTLKDWCDRFAQRRIRVDWGPGRHGPGNNLFAFITDPDGNWIEISAELEVVHDRPLKVWPHEEHTLNMWGPGRLRA